jgi:hypothetical protein
VWVFPLILIQNQTKYQENIEGNDNQTCLANAGRFFTSEKRERREEEKERN